MCAPNGQREPSAIVRVEEVVRLGEFRVVGDRETSVSGAPDGQRPTHFDASQPSAQHPGCRRGGFARHELPEAGDVLLKLSIHQIGAVSPEIAEILACVIRAVQPGRAWRWVYSRGTTGVGGISP